MIATKQVRVFLAVRTVARRDHRERRSLGLDVFRYAAEWIPRGATGHAVYRSKTCDTQAEAVRLARAWLVLQNAPATCYVDTTEQPERFGYSHQEAP